MIAIPLVRSAVENAKQIIGNHRLADVFVNQTLKVNVVMDVKMDSGICWNPIEKAVKVSTLFLCKSNIKCNYEELKLEAK